MTTFPPLAHYSNKVVTSVYSVDQSAEGAGIYKPRGLWLSVEDNTLEQPQSWADWCNAESFGLAPIRHVVIIAPNANILWLKTVDDIDAFTKTFIDEPWYRFHRYVNWKRVANKYQGIVIAPYQWERRFTDHTFWYYGWDCASGCIWDAAAIASIKAD